MRILTSSSAVTRSSLQFTHEIGDDDASTSTDDVVTYDTSGPTVTINQAAGQLDPTGTSPVNFTVVFNEPVTGFTNADINLGGTAGATTVVVSGSGTPTT